MCIWTGGICHTSADMENFLLTQLRGKERKQSPNSHESSFSTLIGYPNIGQYDPKEGANSFFHVGCTANGEKFTLICGAKHVQYFPGPMATMPLHSAPGPAVHLLPAHTSPCKARSLGRRPCTPSAERAAPSTCGLATNSLSVKLLNKGLCRLLSSW